MHSWHMKFFSLAAGHCGLTRFFSLHCLHWTRGLPFASQSAMPFFFHNFALSTASRHLLQCLLLPPSLLLLPLIDCSLPPGTGQSLFLQRKNWYCFLFLAPGRQ